MAKRVEDVTRLDVPLDGLAVRIETPIWAARLSEQERSYVMPDYEPNKSPRPSNARAMYSKYPETLVFVPENFSFFSGEHTLSSVIILQVHNKQQYFAMLSIPRY